VGGNQAIRSNVRIVTATNRHLEQEILHKRFREDLFYRLNVVRIHLPPLRERVADIRLLAEYFLRKIAVQRHKPLLKLSEEAIAFLENYPWPGNVRELENTIQRAVVLATSDVLLPKNIPLGRAEAANGKAAPAPADLDVDAVMDILFASGVRKSDTGLLPWMEREMSIRALKKTSNNQARAARLLGITRATLRKRLEQMGLLQTDAKPAKRG